jgi:DNA topoisomerase III
MYGNLDSSVVSFGPCQTPTLALCVKRHDDILSFVPKKFWTLKTSVKIDGGPTLQFQSDRGRIWEKKKAIDIKESIKKTDAKVIKVAVDKKSIQRPLAMNTVEMLKCASRILGMSPNQAMHVAERLYINGYISYPRTETTKYPSTFDIKGLLKTLSLHPLW